LINGGANNTPTDDIRLLEQAVNLHPAVALQVWIVSELEGSGLTYARQHGVKVIAVGDDPAAAGQPGGGSGPLLAGTASNNDPDSAEALAEYIAANGPSNVQVGVIATNDIVEVNDLYNEFQADLKKLVLARDPSLAGRTPPVGAENACQLGVCADEAIGSVPARGGWWRVCTPAAVR
jgi:hypothetical protein